MDQRPQAKEIFHLAGEWEACEWTALGPFLCAYLQNEEKSVILRWAHSYVAALCIEVHTCSHVDSHSASFCTTQITRAACSLKGTAMKQSCEVKSKRASLAGPFAIHFEARLKPLGWSSSIDLCAAGEKNPAFGVLAAIYASDNQVFLPQFRRFELAVLPLESTAMKAQTSSIGHLIHSHLRRWKELTLN